MQKMCTYVNMIRRSFGALYDILMKMCNKLTRYQTIYTNILFRNFAYRVVKYISGTSVSPYTVMSGTYPY